MKNDSRIVVLIHGYPEPINKEHPIFKYFDQKGFLILPLYLFSPEFKLTLEETKKYFDKILNNKKPEVIVGISFGGLVAPFLVKDFPEAKLVLVASCPYLKIQHSFYSRLLAKRGKWSFVYLLYSVISRMPVWVYSAGYKIFYRGRIKKDGKTALEDHIKQNLEYLKKIPLSENEEAVDFAVSIDNTELLRSLENKTLIFTGKDDSLISPELSQEMHRLIKNSRIVVSDKQFHFDIINEIDLSQLDNFL